MRVVWLLVLTLVLCFYIVDSFKVDGAPSTTRYSRDDKHEDEYGGYQAEPEPGVHPGALLFAWHVILLLTHGLLGLLVGLPVIALFTAFGMLGSVFDLVAYVLSWSKKSTKLKTN